MATTLPRLLATAVLAITLTATAPAEAAQVSGQQLLALCTAGMGGQAYRVEAAECLGFVMVQLVVEHIQKHPTDLITGGHYVVASALAEAYPCPSKTAGN